MPDLLIQSLRGGVNTTDPAHLLAADECLEAMNVEFYLSTLGERRLGCQPFSVVGSGLSSEDTIVHLAEHYPTNRITDPERWVIAATATSSVTVANFASGVWTPITPVDAISPDVPDVYHIRTQSLNGKLFFAYPSNEDRFHVWDGSTLRRTGLPPPTDPPTAVDEGSGTFTGTRYYRTRVVARDGTVVLRRSEPSDAVTFEPSGTGAGATVTLVNPPGEGETDWELEASDDNAFFFRIATIDIGTTTYNDETDLSTTSYADLGPAAEVIGTYLLLPAARFIIADGDRLILGGHFTDQEKQSRVMWTPVFADPGAGNDERLPLATGGDNYVDLDNTDGGGLTGLGQVSNGTWYAFKWSHLYKMTRTGDLTHAYDPICLSKSVGALPGSITSGLDEQGRPCLYFLDPAIGPCMVGSFGLRAPIYGLRNTWARVGFDADGIACRVCYYADKQQVHWWVAVDGASTPNLKIVLQTNNLRPSAAGPIGGGFSLADGLIATATAVGIWHEITVDDGVTHLRGRPFIGLTGHVTQPLFRCDVGDDDNGVAYTATILTRPFFLAGLLNNWGTMRTALLAVANAAASVAVGCVRDFGLEEHTATTTLAPVGSEPLVIRSMDDLVMSEAHAVQFRFSDVP